MAAACRSMSICKTDDKGVEKSEVLLDIQPLPKTSKGARSEPAEPEQATTD